MTDDSINTEDFLFNIDYYRQCKFISFVSSTKGVYEYFVRESGITVKLSEWSQMELKRIDKLRYEKAIEYFSEYDLDDACRLEWRYSGLYYKLSKAAHGKKGKTLKERYRDFSDLLCEKDVYQYICIVQNDSNLVIWRFLKKSIEKEQYGRAFWAFVIKEHIASYVNTKIPFLRKRIKPSIPKFL